MLLLDALIEETVMVPAGHFEVRSDVDPATIPIGRRVRRKIATPSVVYLERVLPLLPTFVLAAGVGTTRRETIRAEIPLHDLTSLCPDAAVVAMVIGIAMVGTTLPSTLDAILLPTLEALAELGRAEARVPSVRPELLLAALAVLDEPTFTEDFLSAHCHYLYRHLVQEIKRRSTTRAAPWGSCWAGGNHQE